MVGRRLWIMKLIEGVLACVIMALHLESFDADGSYNLMITTVTFGGYAIICIGLFIGYMTSSFHKKTQDLFFNILGAVLYILSGALCISYFHSFRYKSRASDMGLAKGALAIIQGIVFIVDSWFVFNNTIDI